MFPLHVPIKMKKKPLSNFSHASLFVYCRIYAQRSRQCAKCLMEIQSSDLVMKARHCVFHVECFKCSACDVVLRKGDLFGMVDEVLYCRMHFDQFGGPPPPTGTAGTIPPPHSTTPNSMGEQEGIFPGFPGYPPQSQFEPGWFPPGGEFSPGGISGTGPMPPGGGGDFPYDNNNEPMLKKRRGRKKRKVENFAAINGYMEGSGASGFPPGLDASGQSKTKRARTSFKHHQLRIMKGHFQINQNPDSRELKMLSQKTGLDKKVLQVRATTDNNAGAITSRVRFGNRICYMCLCLRPPIFVEIHLFA